MVLQCINGVGSNPIEGRTALKSNSNTVWFNFQMYIYFIYVLMLQVSFEHAFSVQV